MACTPYNLAVGLFLNVYTWGTTSPSPWAFALKPGATDIYQLKKSGAVVDEVWIPSAGAVRWIFFPTNNFLAVRDARTSASVVNFSLWIFDLRGTTVTHYEVATGPLSGSTGAQLQFHPSPDGLAFFMFIGDGTNTSNEHKVFRTDTGASLCSWGQIFNVVGQRLAEITSSRTVRIMTSPGPGGPTVYTTCPLPSGKCDVQPNAQSFPDAVVGGPLSLATTTRQFTIKNVGDDCMTVNAIGNIAPFTVTATSKALPAELGPTQTMTVTVTFAPTAVGSFGPVDLPLTCTPANGDSTLRCSGLARSPIKKLTVVPAALTFATTPVGSSSSQPLTLRNDGEVDLALTVPGAPSGSHFQWAAYSGTVPFGGTRVINVAFSPVAEGPDAATLTVDNTTMGTTVAVALSGSGCVPNAIIVVPAAPFPAFGQVQRGFRLVRFFTVGNTGDAPLTFAARIDGADKSLYGLVLDPPAESVVNVVNARSYSVNPTAMCGPGPIGTGLARVAVVFFANDAPRLTSAQLIIDTHNATNPVASSFTFAMSAEIIAPTAVDAALMIDRSGSMAQTIGTRTKSEAAIAGSRLFAQLIRPDLDDRFTAVKYDDVVEVLQPIVGVTSANQPTIVNKFNAAELAPRGLTCIAGGVMVGAQQLATPRPTTPPALAKAMVVLTDGIDNTAYKNPADGKWYSILGGNSWAVSDGMVSTQPVVIPAGIKVYGIGLGKEEDIDKAALNKVSTTTGAYYGIVGDLVGPDYFSLEKYFAQIYMDVVGTASVSDPLFTIAPGEVHKIEFDVLSGDVGALVLVFDYQGLQLPFRILSPTGEVIDGTSVPTGFQLRSGSTTTARFVEFLMPALQPKRYGGRWTVIVQHAGEVCEGDISDRQDRRSGFLPFKCRKYASPVDYGIAIGVGSNFRMQPYLTPGAVRVGDPILLTAVVSEAGLPVTKCVVTVRAVSPSGASWNLTLADDGAHEDGDRDDGEYARRFTNTAEAGSYAFTFRAVGMSRDGQPVVREAMRAKYVEGRIVVEPNGGRPGEPDPCCERLVELLAKALGNRPALEGAPVPPPPPRRRPSARKRTGSSARAKPRTAKNRRG